MVHASEFSTKSFRRQGMALLGILFIAFAVTMMFGPERAVSNADWTVLAASGQAEWRGVPGQGGWTNLETNGHLPDGAEVRTGAAGTAIVAKGLDRIEVHADTSLVVSAHHSPKGKLEVDQTSGSATYAVEKRPAGTFSVKTPYVVAVVKGTRFSVDIDKQGTSVSVTEGRVGVSDTRSGESIDVTPGQKANASASKPGLDVASNNAASSAPAATPAASKASSNNAGGNGGGNGNAGDNGGGNAGGNGGGNAGGNGGGNAGGNGNDNAGGNGNGNAGGNGRGNGNAKDD